MALIISGEELTKAEKQELTRREIEQISNFIFEQMQRAYNRGVKLVSENRYGLTKEDVYAAMGSDSMELLRLGTLLRDVLNIAVPGTLPDDGEPYGN